VNRVRALGWGVALDDVGVNPVSLALIPLLRPDVVKLDASVVAHPPDAATTALVSAVAAEAERTGAVVLAEGIETQEHLAAARAAGAHLGQGWLFGRPAPEPPTWMETGTPKHGIRVDLTPTTSPARTPYALAAAARSTWRANGTMLCALCRHLEGQAAVMGDGVIVLTTFQRAAAFGPVSARYADLAAHAAFITVFGVGMGPEPAPGVKGVDLDPEDLLAPEWDLVVLGSHFSALLTARPAAGEAPAAGRATPSTTTCSAMTAP